MTPLRLPVCLISTHHSDDGDDGNDNATWSNGSKTEERKFCTNHLQRSYSTQSNSSQQVHHRNTFGKFSCKTRLSKIHKGSNNKTYAGDDDDDDDDTAQRCSAPPLCVWEVCAVCAATNATSARQGAKQGVEPTNNGQNILSLNPDMRFGQNRLNFTKINSDNCQLCLWPILFARVG